MRALIYVEGKDDLGALTEIYKRFFDLKVLGDGERMQLGSRLLAKNGQ